MQFDWNEANISHIAAHDVMPEEAEQVIKNDPLEIGKVDFNGEERIVHVGQTDAGRFLIVPVTFRSGATRVVTAYDAKKKFRDLYAQEKAKEHDPDLEDT